MVSILSNLKLSYHQDYSRTSREANLLALGYLPIRESGAYWNDPTGSGLEDNKKAEIAATYNLRTGNDAFNLVVELLEFRARRDNWQKLLDIRARGTEANGGRKPAIETWLADAKSGGALGRSGEQEFIESIERYEQQLGSRYFPPREPVTSLDGYALGLAVAISNWSVGLGLMGEAESLALIEQANELARKEFESWEDFARSFILGRAIHLSGGSFNQEQLKRARKGIELMTQAMDNESPGAWYQLPWQLPA